MEVVTADCFEKSAEVYWQTFHSQTSDMLPDKTVFSHINPLHQVDHIVLGNWKASRRIGIVCYNASLWLSDKIKEEQHLGGFYSYRKHSLKRVELGILRLPHNEIHIIRWRSSKVFVFIDKKIAGILSCSWGLRCFGLGKAEIEHTNNIFEGIKTGLLCMSSPQTRDKTVQLVLKDGTDFSIVIHPKDVVARNDSKEITLGGVVKQLGTFQDNFVLSTKPSLATTPIFPAQTGEFVSSMQLEDKALLLGVAVWLGGLNTA